MYNTIFVPIYTVTGKYIHMYNIIFFSYIYIYSYWKNIYTCIIYFSYTLYMSVLVFFLISFDNITFLYNIIFNGMYV